MAGKRKETETQVVRASELAFEELPNLPKPRIHQIDLGIERTDVLALQPSLASQRRVGFLLSDACAQTDQSELLDVKRATHIIQGLIQDVGQLRRDVSFAQHVLRTDYESKLSERATELYARVNTRMTELEKHHQEKVDIVRRSYRTQLADAIQTIAGEYKAYYDEVLSGKTGRHDLKIKELREKVTEQERALEEQAMAMEKLSAKLQQYNEEEVKEEVPPPPPPGISLEEAERLQADIDQLETDLLESRAELVAREDTNRKLSRQVDTLNRQLEEERGKVARLKRDMEALKHKAKAEKEKAARMAESQMAALQREMKDQLEKAEQEAAAKAEEQADLQRLRDGARHQEELERQMAAEEQLRAEQQLLLHQEKPATDGDVFEQLERLQRAEERQREEIVRLHKEMERCNRTWEMKLAIMQRNFHALRDECFVRHSLQRQSASLHHATLGYAVSGKDHPRRVQPNALRPLPNIAEKPNHNDLSSTAESTTVGSDGHIFPPPPSPLYRAANSPSTRSVHFDENHPSTPDSSQPDSLHSTKPVIHSQA